VRLSASQWSPKLAKDLFSYGLYTFLGFLGKSLRSKSNPFIIASFLGITMVTHFRFAGMGLTTGRIGGCADWRFSASAQPARGRKTSRQCGKRRSLPQGLRSVFRRSLPSERSPSARCFWRVGLAFPIWMMPIPRMVMLILSQALAVSQRPYVCDLRGCTPSVSRDADSVFSSPGHT